MQVLWQASVVRATGHESYIAFAVEPLDAWTVAAGLVHSIVEDWRLAVFCVREHLLESP